MVALLNVIMKILLIEDDKEVALLIKHSLAALHMQVDIVYTGEEAIRLIKLGYYDVILVDLLLNIALNGLEVVRLIRKLDKNIPLIAVTALQDIETKVSTFQAGVDDYVTKPFHFQELAARVQRLCKRISRPYVTKLCYRGITYDIEKRSVVFQQHKIFLKNKEGNLNIKI
jgi:DNA-binding response OmpR family regulator